MFYKLYTKIAFLISGKTKDFDVEKRIFNISVFIAIVVSILSIIINLQLNFPKILHYIIGTGTLILVFIYLRSRLFHKFHVGLFIGASLLILSAAWLYNEGPSGSINYLYILAFIIFLSITERKRHLAISVLLIANILGLYTIHYLKPCWIHNYATDQIRQSDMLFTYSYVVFFAAFIFSALRRNYEIEKNTAEVQKVELEHINKHITDSIVYAKEIQQALLQNTASLDESFAHYFVFWQPKDIVSGDFYLFRKFPSNPDKVIVVVSDCTGHGVPGALLTMLGISIFNEIFLQYRELNAHDFLQVLKDKLTLVLQQGNVNHRNQDGMDMAICILDKKQKTLEYAGANRPLLVVRNQKMIVLKGSRMTIGSTVSSDRRFKSHRIDVIPGDTLYLFTDGFADQFGGHCDRKYYAANLKKILVQNSTLTMSEQERKLRDEFVAWKGSTEQTDDVLVLGVKPNLT